MLREKGEERVGGGGAGGGGGGGDQKILLTRFTGKWESDEECFNHSIFVRY